MLVLTIILTTFVSQKQLYEVNIDSYYLQNSNNSFKLRGCLNFARQINQIDFLGEFQPSLVSFSPLNSPNEG